jgi:small subunit ribosomal protein S24e
LLTEYGTQITFIHPSSVNHTKREVNDNPENSAPEKQLYAFAEKRQNVAMGGSSAQMFLVTTTRLDPLSYMLFGAYNIEVTERGLECDGWLPIIGNIDALDDIQRLKTLMESCMLRVFEGITMSQNRRLNTPNMPRQEESEFGDDFDTMKDLSLSQTEIKELDLLTRDIVRILNHYNEERISAQSRQNSRAATPMGGMVSSIRSGFSTPYNHGSPFNSRPGTPSRLWRRS